MEQVQCRKCGKKRYRISCKWKWIGRISC